MDLRSRPGLVGHEVATRKWTSRPGWMGDRRFGVATKVFEVTTRAFCRGNRGWSRPGLEVTTWLGWA